MNLLLMLGVVVLVQAGFLLSALALAARLDRQREQNLNEFLRTNGGAL